MAYLALSERMAKLEAGADLASYRIASIEAQVRELISDSKRTLENTATTKTMVENIRDEMRRR